MYQKFLASAAFVTVMACAPLAFAYDTTTFSVTLGDPSHTGTISIGEGSLGNGTASISAGANVYNAAYQYFTPTVSGTYVFGQLSAPDDTVILLYTPSFATGSPDQNFSQMNDDGDPSVIADAGLQSYVTTAIAGRSCGGSDGLCPLLESSLVAGTDYYIVVSTYMPGMSLGNPGDILSFFVIGNALVGVGGVPPAGYVSTASPSPVSTYASYLNDNDNSGDLATVAAYLDTASEAQVVEAMKEIFPVNTAVSSQVMKGASGQTATVLIDKVGTVLGNISTPSSASFANGSFDTGTWIFGGASSGAASPAIGFAQADSGMGSSGMIASLASMPYKKFEDNGRAFWVQGVGGITNGDGSAATHGYDVTNAGIVSGYEFALSSDNLIGVIGSAFKSDIDLDNNAGDVDASTYSLGLYGQHLMGSTKVTGIFLASYSDYDSQRFVDVGGVTGRPQADYNGWGTSTTLALSRLYEQDDVKVEPFISANYTTTSTDGYSEAGGGAFNMNVASDSSSTASLKGGITFQHDLDLSGNALNLKVKPYLGYQWELNEAGSAVSLSGATSSVV